MGRTVVLACRTLEKELLLAMERTGVDFETKWVESGLHDTPKRLHARLEELVAEIDSDAGPGEGRAGRILLAFGFCGNSLVELKSKRHDLVLPRVDDCISLLLGSLSNRVEISRRDAAIFLTEGWMRGERNIWVEYTHMIDRYGQEQADDLIEMMYGHYRTLGLIDDGAYDIEALLDETAVVEQTLGLSRKVYKGTLSYLEDLLTGPWDSDRFVVKPPGEELTQNDFLMV